MTTQHRHNDFVGYRIYETHRALYRDLEKALSPFNVTPGEWNALNQLAHLGPLSQRNLANALQKEQATITRTVDRMVKKGLVTRTPDPNDRRANIISLTAEANQLLGKIEPHAIEAADNVTQGISDEELGVFFDVLRRVRENATAGQSASGNAD